MSLEFHKYPQKYGGGVALQFVHVETGEPGFTATVNIPAMAHSLEPNQVFIKNWSENEGVLDELVRLGIVEDTGLRVPTGFVEAAVCKLLVAPPG